MIWNNKGHEFDEIGKRFQKKEKMYIYGGGSLGTKLYESVKHLGCFEGFIDNYKKMDGIKVISIFDFLKLPIDQYIVVVAAGKENEYSFMKQLRKHGYKDGVNLFNYSNFREHYMPIYLMYSWNKVYMDVCSFLCTTKCNLNCKACLNFTPYNENKKHYDLQRLKEDVDCFFQWVDAVGLFHVSGGEPFLYPYLPEILEYIGVHYRDKIGEFSTTTNGTIIPNEKICSILVKYNINLCLDDYTSEVPIAKKNYDSVYNYLVNHGVHVIDRKVETWIDLKPIEVNEDIIKSDYFTACSVPFRSLHNKKIYLCNYNDYAVEAGIVSENENDFFDISKFKREERMQLMEFMNGYSDRGYCELCGKCKGYVSINPFKEPVAEQV